MSWHHANHEAGNRFVLDGAREWCEFEATRQRLQRTSIRPVVPRDQSQVVRRARAFFKKSHTAGPAISGQRGHDRTFHIACILVKGYGLDRSDAWQLLKEYNETCQPPWTDKELRHKLDDAEKQPGEVGYLLKTEKPRVVIPTDLDFGDEQESAQPEFLPGDFPLDCFPETVKQFCAEVAGAVGCPVDFPAVACLMVAATALGNTRAIGLARKWSEAARFYTAVVADPGAAKTPAVNMVCQPLYEMQRKLKIEFDERYKRFESDVEKYRAEIEAYRAETKRRVREPSGGQLEPPVKPEKPTCQHLYTSDATTEFLADALATNPRGFALIRDELTGWVLGMNQYKGGKGSDRQFFLSAWSGEPAKVDRKSQERGPVLVSHPFLNVFGSIQPDMLGELKDERGREDGFVHRVLFSFPEPMPAQDRLGEVSEGAEQHWKDVIYRLLSVTMYTDTDGHARPYVVKLDAEAKAEWDEWYRQHAAERRDAKLPPELTGPWSKMVAYCARLILVVHFLRWATNDSSVRDEVDAVSVLLGAALAEYFKSHAKKTYKMLTCDQADHKAERAIQWIRKQGGKVSTRKMILNGLVGLKRNSDAIKLLRDLEDRGLGVYCEAEQEGGRHSRKWFEAKMPNGSNDNLAGQEAGDHAPVGSDGASEIPSVGSSVGQELAQE